MASLTVLVQQVASVAIFCCAFVVIFQERVSPVTIVGWASFCSFLAWVLWDYWIGQEEVKATQGARSEVNGKEEGFGNTTAPPKELQGLGLGLSREGEGGLAHSPNPSATSSNASKTTIPSGGGASPNAYEPPPPYVDPASSLSPRNQQRLATVKSAILIYAALLGLSPILKSLTRSTTSDSIWAFTTWLLFMNVAFFDYSSGTGAQYVHLKPWLRNYADRINSLPASISTNSALMASTVLASRLPSTTHVFSLSLFSIEVFGLFPIFRRQLRAKSPNGHLALTIALISTAGGSLFVVLTGGSRIAFVAGMILGSMATFLAMGMCSWYLIGLQKYKNEIYGPWDPARPIIRRRWD
jgi:phosphatidylinositol glycan class C protein